MSLEIWPIRNADGTGTENLIEISLKHPMSRWLPSSDQSLWTPSSLTAGRFLWTA